jgi:hypothetical protein
MIVQTALAVVWVLGLLVAEAEPAGKAYTIGILTGDSPFHRAFVGTFKQTLFDLGYDEKQIHFKERFAESEAVAAKAATRSTPIVFAMVTDPIASGLVATLAKPGGNVTGMTDIQAEISAKRVQLLKERLPRLSRVAVLWNAGHPGKRLEFNEIASGARVVGVGLVSVEVRTANDFDAAFRRLTQTQVDALIVLAEPLVLSRIADILQFTAQRRLSDMYEPDRSGGRGTPLLRVRHRGPSPSGGWLCGSDPQRREARRPSRRTADKVRAGDQSEDCEDAGPHDPAVAAAAGGSHH